jgi:hypothetical protein
MEIAASNEESRRVQLTHVKAVGEISNRKHTPMLQPAMIVAGIAARSAIRYCAPGCQVLVGAAATYVGGLAVASAGYHSFLGARYLTRKVMGWPTEAEIIPPAPPAPPPAAAKANAKAPHKPTFVPDPVPAT